MQDKEFVPAPIKCPLCKSHIKNVPLFDLYGGLFITDRGSFAIKPLQIRFLFNKLYENYSKTVSHDDLLYAMYHGQNEPENAFDVMKQNIHRLRKFIAESGYSIANDYGMGYRLIPGSYQKYLNRVAGYK